MYSYIWDFTVQYFFKTLQYIFTCFLKYFHIFLTITTFLDFNSLILVILFILENITIVQNVNNVFSNNFVMFLDSSQYLMNRAVGDVGSENLMLVISHRSNQTAQELRYRICALEQVSYQLLVKLENLGAALQDICSRVGQLSADVKLDSL